MARPKKPKPRLPTLEEQLKAMPPRPKLDAREPWMDAAGVEAQIAWDRQRRGLLVAIFRRDNKLARDPGADASGNFAPSPYATRGHDVEIAPKTLGKELSKDASYPKMVATQRVIDRYKARSQITFKQFRAAEFLLRAWQASGLEPSMAANYDPVQIPGSTTVDARIAKRVDGATAWVDLMAAVPYHSRGVVRAVVIEDRTAGEWARQRGIRQDDSGRVGMGRLRAGLSALVDYLRY